MGTVFVVSIFVLFDVLLLLGCAAVARCLAFFPEASERFAGFALAFLACFVAIMVCVPPWAQFVNGTLDPIHHILFFGPILACGTASAVTAPSISEKTFMRMPSAEPMLRANATASPRLGVPYFCRRVLLSAALMLAVICVGMAVVCCLGVYEHEGVPSTRVPKEAAMDTAHGARFLLLTTLFHTQSPFWDRTPFRLSDLIGLEVTLSESNRIKT